MIVDVIDILIFKLLRPSNFGPDLLIVFMSYEFPIHLPLY